MYAQVIVDIAAEGVDRVFTYALPDGGVFVPGTRVLVPFGPKRQVEGVILALSETTDLAPGRIKPVIRALDDYPVILPSLLQIADFIHTHSFCTLSQALRLMIPAGMRGARVHEKTVARVCLLVQGENLKKALKENARAPRRLEVLRTLEQAGGQMARPDLTRALPGCGDALKALEKQGVVEVVGEEVYRRPYGGEEVPAAQDPPLTPQQERCMGQLAPALQAGRGQFLLYGVTGSGKTEVFIRAARQVLSKGKTAIVLVPEISLTPQMVLWFRSRFGNTAAVLHSRLSAGERYDEWRRIRRGEARVVIGARSAIFAPVQNLGLIIVDEEHEQSYISDRTPYYDAREIGMERCRQEGAVLVLASATPSMRSFALAGRGDLTLLEMPERVNKRPLPQVHIVDMRRELEAGNRSVFSRPLQEGLSRCLSTGQQAILFVNRRGYATFVSCRSCGYVVRCPHCDISMTYHASGERMRCHYCNTEADVPEVCPECGSPHIKFFGVGTQRVQSEVEKLFPGVSTVRMDNDTTREKDAHATLLARFRRGEAQVLIGTQMIAKGLDFPNVTLVGIMAADATLNLPDYRAGERTFQLLTQVAGRAGRAEIPGEVFLQTYQPENGTVLAASRQDYRAFYEAEMARRRMRYYPPFAVIVRNVYESAQEEAAKEACTRGHTLMEEFFETHAYLKKYLVYLRCMPCPVARIADKYRWELVMSIIDLPVCLPAQGRMSEISGIEAEGVACVCQINPAGMM